MSPWPAPAWPPARIATSAATSTSFLASSIARMRPAAVCAASRIATADCSAAAATGVVLDNLDEVKGDVLGGLFGGSGLVWYGGAIGGAIAVLAVLVGGFALGLVVSWGRRAVPPPMSGEWMTAWQGRRATEPPRRGVKLAAFVFGMAWVLFAAGFRAVAFLRDLLPGGGGLPQGAAEGLGFSVVCLLLAAGLAALGTWSVLRHRDRRPRC